MKLLTLLTLLLFPCISFSQGETQETGETEEPTSTIILTDVPSNYQVFQRDDENQCHISLEGRLATLDLRADLTVDIFTRSGYENNYELISSFSFVPEEDGSFLLNYIITAELKEWKFVLKNSSGGELDQRIVEHITCGDIYALLGQSNASALGTEASPHISIDDLYQNRYARAVGKSIYGYEDKENPSNFLGWGPAGAHFYSSYLSGGLGLPIQGEIIQNHNIPVGLINASYPGTEIDQHLENAGLAPVADPPYINGSGYNLFEFFLSKLDRAGARNTIKTILWYQGEADRDKEVNCGNRYITKFRELKNSWHAHLPALENIYIYQLNTSCQSSTGGSVPKSFNEAQRELDLLHSDITLIPTVGLGESDMVNIDYKGDFDGCHYTYAGMIKNALRTVRFLEKQTYSPSTYADNEVFTSHPLSSSYDASSHTLVIDFKYAIALHQITASGYSNQEVKDYFFDENDHSIKVNSLSISGKQLFLTLHSSQNIPKSISYLPINFYNPQATNKDTYFGPWLISKYGNINRTIDYPSNPVPPINIHSVIGVPSFHQLPVRPSTVSNDWLKIWSNEGQGDIDLHQIDENTEIIAGDFNGDGEEEILLLGSTWISVLKFQENHWEWLWSNLGVNTHTINSFYGEHFLVGDFNGNGSDQLFCNNGSTAKIFSFNGSGFSLDWTSNSTVNPYLDHIIAGDFDGNGKVDLLGSDLSNDQSSLFFFNSNNFSVDWTTDPNHSAYAPNHQWFKDYQENLKPGNFDNSGKDLVLALGGYATVIYYHDHEWHWLWSDLGSGSIGGWSYPLNTIDELHIGHIDNDEKEELLFLQNGSSAYWAASIDFQFNGSAWDWNWNWSINPVNGIQHLADWPINESPGSHTRYLLAKLTNNKPEHLIAMRKFSCNESSRYLINIYEPVNTNKKRQSTTTSTMTGVLQNKDQVSGSFDIQIFPNPSDGVFELSLNPSSQITDFKEEITIQCYDIRGIKIKEITKEFDIRENVTLNYSDLSPGLYTLVVKSAGNIMRQKMIIR